MHPTVVGGYVWPHCHSQIVGSRRIQNIWEQWASYWYEPLNIAPKTRRTDSNPSSLLGSM